jgi:PleD family two-component response regulator
MGVAQCRANQHKSLHDLINRADENLYKAKESGRNRLVI